MHFLVLFLNLILFVFSSSSFCFAFFVLHPVSFSPPQLLSCFFLFCRTFCPTMLLLHSSLHHFLFTPYQIFLFSPVLVPVTFLHTLSLCIYFILFSFSFLFLNASSSFFQFFPDHSPVVEQYTSLRSCVWLFRLTLSG